MHVWLRLLYIILNKAPEYESREQAACKVHGNEQEPRKNGKVNVRTGLRINKYESYRYAARQANTSKEYQVCNSSMRRFSEKTEVRT